LFFFTLSKGVDDAKPFLGYVLSTKLSFHILFSSASLAKTQGSCPLRSGEALELSQGWLKALFLSYRWIRREIATSGYIEYRQGIPRFCESLLSAAKQCIPRSRRKNIVPRWGKECETLCRSFIPAPVRTDFDRVALSLLSRLEQKKQDRWEEAVNSIDFSHSSRKVWSTINKPTGRSGRSSRLCSVSSNSIASNGEERGTRDRGPRVYQAYQQSAVPWVAEHFSKWGATTARQKV